jgi:endoglucanase
MVTALITLVAPKAVFASEAPMFWTGFRERFLLPEGRIVDSGNGGVSHSEGQSYGLLFAEAAGDRESFDLIWRWTQANLTRSDVRLFSWRFDPRNDPHVADPNNASDGDLVIAWSLMRAAFRWSDPAYAQAAEEIRAAIASRLIAGSLAGPVLLPGLAGFQKDGARTLNLSYYVWPALDAFATADPDGPWRKLAATGEALLAKAQFGPAALPCDWLNLDANGAVAPAQGWPARFGYDAVRIPLYLAWSGRSTALAPFCAYWGPFLAAKKTPPAWIDVLSGETAPYPAPSGFTAIARLACGLSPGPPDASGDYYGSALAGLAALA